jgi:hypothetical protein
VDHELLRPKAQVCWRPAAGEEFPTEGTGETVVFLAHIKRGFGIPTGDFLRGLLHFYRIELVHLAPNSITIISTFVHLCEAYLGITPISTSGATSLSRRRRARARSSAAPTSCYIGT